jgi:hypothetical protein
MLCDLSALGGLGGKFRGLGFEGSETEIRNKHQRLPFDDVCGYAIIDNQAGLPIVLALNGLGT